MNTLLKFDIRLKQDAINGHIPEELKPYVKSFHLTNWRRRQKFWSNRVGYDYYHKRDENIAAIEKELVSVKKELKKAQLENELLRIIRSSIVNSYDSKIKEKIVEFTKDKSKELGFNKWSEIIGVSREAFRRWRQLSQIKCNHSIRSICIKPNHNQLTKEEELLIIKLLLDPRYEHFPLISLVWKARYENIVYATFRTWSRIQKENNILRNKVIKKNVKKHIPLKSTYANEYLHADITYFKLPRNKTYYIYIVKDNYSKYIKSWCIAKTINADLRIKTFKDAMKDINDETTPKVTFITDNGSENKNNKVKQFFTQFENICIKYAKVDIRYSNSMVERFNQDLKYMYLYRETVDSYRALNKLVAYAVREHNNVKRLGSLKGQTPFEVYKGAPPKTDWINENWRQAKINRQRKIKNTNCCLTGCK